MEWLFIEGLEGMSNDEGERGMNEWVGFIEKESNTWEFGDFDTKVFLWVNTTRFKLQNDYIGLCGENTDRIRDSEGEDSNEMLAHIFIC